MVYCRSRFKNNEVPLGGEDLSASLHSGFFEDIPAGLRSEEVFLSIETEARKLGFEYCAHGLRLPVPVTKPRTTYFSNYDPEWQERYEAQNYLSIDPTIAHGMRSTEPALWTNEFFALAPQLWQEAQSYGLRHGVAQSHRDAGGTYSMLVLARSQEPISTVESRSLFPQLEQLTRASHGAMKASCDTPDWVSTRVELTEREIEVLRWTADGKTSAEIAEILGISERTINFHVNTATSKLGACNKTSAVVRAAMLGLMW